MTQRGPTVPVAERWAGRPDRCLLFSEGFREASSSRRRGRRNPAACSRLPPNCAFLQRQETGDLIVRQVKDPFEHPTDEIDRLRPCRVVHLIDEYENDLSDRSGIQYIRHLESDFQTLLNPVL